MEDEKEGLLFLASLGDFISNLLESPFLMSWFIQQLSKIKRDYSASVVIGYILRR